MLLCRKPKIFDIDALALAAVFAICALTWWLVIQPLDTKIEQQCAEKERYQQENESAQSQLTHLQSLVKKRQAVAANLKKTKNILKECTGMPEVIRQIGRISQACGIRLDEIQPGETIYGPQYNQRPLRLRIYGSFPQLHALLTQLTKDMPYVKVSALSMNQGSQTQTGGCDCTLLLDVFGPHWQSL